MCYIKLAIIVTRHFTTTYYEPIERLNIDHVGPYFSVCWSLSPHPSGEALWWVLSRRRAKLLPPVVTKATTLAASVSIEVFHLTPVVRPIQDSLTSASQVAPRIKDHT